MDLIESYSEELQLIRKPFTRVWVSGLVLAAALLPFYAPGSVIPLATIIMVWTVGIMGQNLLIGYTGQVSFGQIGFLIIGAAVFGHLARAGLPWPLALIAAGLAAGLFGILVGFPSLRLKGPYLAIATLGFGLAVHQIFAHYPVLSGGRMPLDVPQIGDLWGLPEEIVNFYVCFIIAGLFTLLTYNIVSSYMGRAFIAIRDNDIAAEVLGVNLTFYKLLAFGISSVYVGVQGGLTCLLLGSISQNMFPLTDIFDILVGVIVGGLGLVEGSILGAAFVRIIPQMFSQSAGLVPIVYGAAIIVVMIFQPLGLAGMWLKMRLYVRMWPFR